MRITTSIFAFCMTIVLSGCAVPQHVTEHGNSVVTDRLDHPFSMRLSIKAGVTVDGVSETNRVTGRMWGNGAGPIRLDLSLGIGTTLAQCLEDGPTLYVYIPREENLYISTEPRFGGPTLSGFKLPFSLREIALLAHGCFIPLTEESRRGDISKTSTGLPSRWSDHRGWTVDFSYHDESRPYKITAIHKDGSEVLVIVKRLERVPHYGQAQLRLDVPTGTTVK